MGGFFNVLLAPMLFNDIFEYPLMIVATCLLRPEKPFFWTVKRSEKEHKDALWRANIYDYLAPTTVLLVTLWLLSDKELIRNSVFFLTENPFLGWLVLAAIVFAIFMTSHRPKRFALTIAVILITPLIGKNISPNILFQERNFFGVYKVEQTFKSEDTSKHTLKHGTTIHGSQWRDLVRRTFPTTYYYKNGPVGEVFRTLHLRNKPLNVAAIGLGAGTIACYNVEGDQFTFFELDPYVEEIARNLNAFTFLDDCAPNARVVIGDARISLAKEKPASFDMIFVDAFSSDAIPVHLMTTEAIDMYFSKLKSDGIIMFHTSNRYAELSLPLATYAWMRNIAYKIKKKHRPSQEDFKTYNALGGTYIMLARDNSAFDDRIINDPDWREKQNPPYVRPWTDDYANVLGSLLVRYFLQRNMIPQAAYVLEKMID